ncbi:hypothetical protein ACFZDG_11125 [Kitasatospora xanthocidica]|uniref:hypothetical protein n=1 Tax=Kitasatospora xanthocidica TaxID=83382 RepID=UPI0036EF1589
MGTPMHGEKDYYLATATVIPLLLIAYLFSMDAPGAAQRLNDMPHGRLKAFLSITGLLAPALALVGAIGGGAACLLALYSGRPTGTHSWWSIFGLVSLLVAGFIHLVIVICAEIFDAGAKSKE